MAPVEVPEPLLGLPPGAVHVALEILEPESVKLVEAPVLMLAPALLATARLLGVGQGGIDDTVTDAVAFAVVVVQAPVELAT